MAGLFFPGGSDHCDWEFIMWAYEGRVFIAAIYVNKQVSETD
jgi:hypothetical protein